MCDHYQKHVVNEHCQAKAKNIVEYTKQAKQFYENNISQDLINPENIQVKIRIKNTGASGYTGGVYNSGYIDKELVPGLAGLIRSFWYK